MAERTPLHGMKTPTTLPKIFRQQHQAMCQGPTEFFNTSQDEILKQNDPQSQISEFGNLKTRWALWRLNCYWEYELTLGRSGYT
jgi:hypothetical protein